MQATAMGEKDGALEHLVNRWHGKTSGRQISRRHLAKKKREHSVYSVHRNCLYSRCIRFVDWGNADTTVPYRG